MSSNADGEKRALEDSGISSEPKRVKHEHETSAGDGNGNGDTEMAEVGTTKNERAGTEEAEGSTGKGKKANRDKRGLKYNGRRAKHRDESPPVRDGPKEPRLPKRQTAILLGFCGSKYRGMQFQRLQPGQPELATIEGELFKALIAAGAVSKDNAEDPVKVNFARAARTDAGVHAVGNVVSMKMITEVPGVPSVLDRTNELLPEDIRIWGLQRVQNSFNAHIACDGRKYTYFFPSYLLIPPKPGCGLDRAFREYAASTSQEVAYASDPFWDVPDAEKSTPEEDFTRKRAWRATPAHMERLREVVKKFERTHNFHNFTVAEDPKDKSNNRYMKSLEVKDPAVYGETEWIAVELNGQSFMLHQIVSRKMMFALVMICRTQTPSSIIDQLYTLTTVNVPKMPALGLLLEYPVFDLYTKKLEAANEKYDGPSDPGYREPISFEKYADQMSAFKQKYIYDNMRSIEDRKGLFDAWIRSVDAYAGGDLLYFNPAGTIPEASVVKRGERREKPFREQRKFNLTSFAEDDNEKMKPDEQGEDVDVERPLSKKEMQEAEG
ncbi:tRNA pseudouridine synthase 1 [Marasmius crinis-equi]|uniref:tRNA pseudouridine synthase 1 n=1 Tax=Marasmius crinis-equi TaxID=585013 RepID=A0ABR3FPG6_9AGAR